MKTQGKFRSVGVRVAVLAASAVLLAACADRKDKPATQAAARVNKEEITVHQINFVLEQQRVPRAEQQGDDAGRRALERLIDQELALQKAGELKIDRDPRVAQQLDAARREIIARAYFEKVGDGASKPSADEVRKYYEDNPALFRERRVYQLHEAMVETRPEQVAALRSRLEASKNFADFAEYLKANEFRFTASQAVRAAEQLPLGSVATFAKLKDGQALLNATPAGAQIIFIAASRLQPVDEAQARPAIEQFLLNERKRRVIGDDLQALRGAAKIQYMGKFAQGAASASAAQPASASAPPTVTEGPGTPAAATAGAAVSASGASGPMDTPTINKGLGIK